MRILFLDTKPIRRGAQIFSHALSEYYRKNGIEVERIYLFKNDSQVSLSIDDQDELLEGDEKNIQEKILTIQPLLLHRLIRSIKKFNPDIILLNGSKTLKYGAWAKKFVGNSPKFVYRVIDSPKFWNTGAFTKLFYKNFVIPSIDASVGVSKASLNDMKSLYGFKKKSTVIHRAVNFESFIDVPDKIECRRKLNIPIESKVILFLGNLTSQKRPDRFVNIINQLNNKISNLHAIVVGDGPLKTQVQKQIDENKLNNIIVLYGYQSQVGDFINASDLLLLTSDTEGLPGIVPEAGFFKVPTIASNVGGINECIENNVSGFVVEKNNLDDFVNKALELFSDHSKIVGMGDAAKKIAETNFNIHNISKSYLDFFQSL